ncbi:hypothetical protein OOZ63_17830 [Paucibacter sp. PLA-PC-4]|uniref:hypothetical protein n=1 Tax=Paucibacter sp. PLA-PC-4 TaxID=2993655 RepID=UPI00224B517D|nr:hypothetical protein [Paucibacter sp. PLA-PC-4]MCX2863692.1 hypothetical protein [Paucibacter sp. PLA-PC-4]
MLSTSGCSLLDPYVRAKEVDALDGAAASGLPEERLARNSALAKAITATAAQRKAYYDAVSDRAKLRNGLPLLLVPLGAMALYKGVASDGGESTRRLLLKEGLIGGTAYGLGGYYTSTAREQIYLAGAKSLSCSIYAMTPYSLPGEVEDRLSITALQRDFEAAGALEAATADVRAIKDKTPAQESTVHAQLQTFLTRSDASLAAARLAYQQAASTQSSLTSAAANLRAATESVIAEVNLQLSTLEPDLSAILTLVDSLPTNAQRLVPGGKFSRTAAPGEVKAPAIGVAGDENSVAIQTLSRRIQEIDVRTASLRFALDQVAQGIKSVPPLPSCQVAARQDELSVSPSGTVRIAPGETQQIVIRSSAGIPSVEWAGAVHPDIVLTKTVAGETMLAQVNYKKAVTGITEMTIEAATRTSKKQIPIELTAPSAPASAASTAGDAAAAQADSAAAVKAEVKKKAQAGAPQTTAPTVTLALKDPPTIPAVVAVQPNPAASTPAATVTAPGILAPRNSFEKSLLQGERLKTYQLKLKVPTTGVFDAATREEISKWKKARDLPADGTLSEAIGKEILK